MALTNSVGLYIHIPFCTKICPFCDFTKLKATTQRYKPYIDACCREISGYYQRKKIKVDTLFFGGGTPSVLPVEFYVQLFDQLHESFDMSQVAEVTMEFNPEDVAIDYLEKMIKLGVTRVSLGVQSFIQKECEFLGRGHTVEQSFSALDILKRYCVDVSLDFMFGLPDSTLDDLLYSLKRGLFYDPDHISCYGLTIEPNTPFFDLGVKPVSSEKNFKLYQCLIDTLSLKGYTHYEVSSFAKDNKQCKHNNRYWRFLDYIGIGCGAHSLIDGNRICNSSHLGEYLNDSSMSLFDKKITRLTSKELICEHIIANFRTPQGVIFEDYKHRYDIDFLSVFAAEIDRGVSLGLIKKSTVGLTTTKKGLCFLNDVCLLFV